jgi:CRISPR-associated endonuclease Csn1
VGHEEASAAKFIEDLIGLCQYTGEPVLPKDSLLYSEYMLRNELNSLKVNGHSLPSGVREEMIKDLFSVI